MKFHLQLSRSDITDEIHAELVDSCAHPELSTHGSYLFTA